VLLSVYVAAEALHAIGAWLLIGRLASASDVRDRGLPVILISHNMPHVFEVADRIHIQRLGRRATVITPQSYSMSEAVAIMTGAAPAVA
jgi:ABC-type sugar transport system ATPase subunit